MKTNPLAYSCFVINSFAFTPLLVGDQFHIYLTAQAQNAVPRILALLAYQT